LTVTAVPSRSAAITRARLDGCARRTVGHEAAPGHRLHIHRDHHDPPAAAREHPRRHLAGDQERPRHLRRDHVAKALRRDLPQRLVVGHEARVDGPHADSGVAHHQVEAAEALVHLIDAGADRGLVADV
jgi:hypothetical protein